MAVELLNFPILIDALNEVELNYELSIRHALPSGTHRQKVIELHKLLKAESKPPMDHAEDDEDFTKSIEALSELQKILKQSILTADEQKQKITQAKIRHYQDRAFRSMGNDDEKDSILFGIVRNIKRIIRTSVEEISSVKSANSQRGIGQQNETIVELGAGRGRGRKSISSIHAVNKPQTTATQGENQHRIPSFHKPNSFNDTSYTDPDLVQLMQNLRPPSVVNDWRSPANIGNDQPYIMQRRRVAVEKWPIRFKGDNNPSLADFLSKIELYARSEEIQLSEVYRGFFKLLEDVALEWYEVKAAEFNNWSELVVGLKTRFQSRNYDFIVREEILERYQRPNENIADYLLNMYKLFSKIYPPVEEQYKVYILQRNMIAEFRMQLAVANITSVKQLEDLCRNIDEARMMGIREKLLKPVQLMKTSIDPVKRLIPRCNAVEEEVAEVQQNNIASVPRFQQNRRRGFTRREDNTVVCWNCKIVGHRHFDCFKPKNRIYCWCCGMEGVTADKCPKKHPGGGLFTCTNTQQNKGNDGAGR